MSYLEHIKKASKNKSEDPNAGKPVANRFHDIETIDRRRHQVLDYLVMGCTTEEIADYMGETKSVIKNDIEEIQKIGYQARAEDLETVRDEIMRYYRVVAREGVRGFMKSRGEHEKITDESGSGGKGPFSKQKVVTEELAGDPRFLSVVIDAGKEMGKLSGAQKHKEVEVQNNIQNNNAIKIVSQNRTEMPKEFDRWMKKPEEETGPTVDGEVKEDEDA